MFGPLTLFAHATYTTLPDGNGKAYYAEIPFAGVSKTLSLSADIDTLSSLGNGARVAFQLEQSLDGRKWDPVGSDPFSGPLTATGFSVKQFTTDYGNRLRLAMTVSEPAG